MIDWAGAWLFFALVAIAGYLVGELLHRDRKGGARLCRLTHSELTPGTVWCGCTTCGECIMCPKEDRRQ